MSTRAPGVYVARDAGGSVRLELGPCGVPGFVGLTQRGPTNEPVRLTSFEEFRRIYGDLDAEVYLDTAVSGFFENGGEVCYVLRVAHQVARRGETVACPSTCVVLDGSGVPTLKLSAASEGQWGNRVSVHVERQEPRVSTFLTLDLREGDTSAVIKSTHGLSKGSIVRIRDHEAETYRTITDLDGKTIGWDPGQPLERAFRSGAPTFIEPLEFTVGVRWGASKERFENLSLSTTSERYAEQVINRQSALIHVSDLRSETSLPESYPVTMEPTCLEGGADGLFSVTPEDFIGANIGPGERYGLAALEHVEEIDLLVIPDLMWALEGSEGFRTEKDVWVVQDAMITQCERLKTRFTILDFPDGRDHRRASQWRLLFDSAYAAFYYPWVMVSDGQRSRLVPPSGHVAGIYARCDNAMGPYRAPANEAVNGIFDMGRDLTDGDIGQLNKEGINCLKSLPQRGIRVWGARTASSDPAWRYVPVRRIVNSVISSVERGLQWSVFENNDRFLWKQLVHQVTSFLLELWQAGFFKGATPEDAFYVKCDAETNPPEVQNAGQVVVECGVAPVRPAEFVVFKVDSEIEQRGSGA
ncbi:MAG: phage tail sheath family protein [Myxococcota bacterium]